MPANFTLTKEGTTLFITSTNDGNEDPTTYTETTAGTGATGAVNEPVNVDGSSNDIIWSAAVQDGTMGTTGGRGPAVFNLQVELFRPRLTLGTAIVADSTITTVDLTTSAASTFPTAGTVNLGDKDTGAVFSYDRIINSGLRLESDTPQTITTGFTTSPTTLVFGYQEVPDSVNSTTTLDVVIEGTTTPEARTFNQIALRGICEDQTGQFSTGGVVTGDGVTLVAVDGVDLTAAGSVTQGNVNSIQVTDGTNFTNQGVLQLQNGTFTYTLKSGNTFSNTEAQSIESNTDGSPVTQSALSCSLSTGGPRGGDVVSITYLEANTYVDLVNDPNRTDKAGNTANRSAIHNGQGTSLNNWTAFALVIDGDLLVAGTVVAEALVVDGATLIPNADGTGELTVGEINADNIAANSINAKQINTGAVNTEKLNLNGRLDVVTTSAGSIAWGKDSATNLSVPGLFMGNTDAGNTTSRFILGDAESYILFDGTELYVVGATFTNPNTDAVGSSIDQAFRVPASIMQTSTLDISVGVANGISGNAIITLERGTSTEVSQTFSFTGPLNQNEVATSVRNNFSMTGYSVSGTANQVVITSNTEGDTFLTDWNPSDLSGDNGRGAFTTTITDGLFYSISPVHTKLEIQLSGAGGGGGAGGTVGTDGLVGGETVVTVQRRVRDNGVDNFIDRYGVLGAFEQPLGSNQGGLESGGITPGTFTEIILSDNVASTTTGFLERGAVTLTTQKIGINGDSRVEDTFTYTATNELARGTGNLNTDIGGNNTFGENVLITEIVLRTISGAGGSADFGTSGTLVFGNTETWQYSSVSIAGGLATFTGTVGLSQSLNIHLEDEVVSTEATRYSFSNTVGQTISNTHTDEPTFTKIIGDPHRFRAAGGTLGASGVGTATAGDPFDVVNENLFSGTGGDAGASGENGTDGGLNLGNDPDVSDGGGGAGVSGGNAGAGGGEGSYLTATTQLGDDYQVVSATDRILIEVGRGGRGTTGTTNGGSGGDGLVVIRGKT